jgi:4-diphosphocytidyl-2-C-methyl-D-erythritol kinase
MGGDRMARQLVAPAKINLYLHIVGRRDDGYHLVDSLIAFAEAGDSVTVSPAATLGLVADGPFAGALPAQADNLVLRAAAQLRAQAGVATGAAITLTKNLPVAAGIGGGSADAAAALRALAVLWRVRPANCDLAAIAQTLGTDVPVCLGGRTSRVIGIGDRIVATPDLPAAPVVLANPGVAVPTAAVFCRYAAAPAPRRAPANPDWDGLGDVAALVDRLAGTDNDLEPAATAIAPAVSNTLAALRALPGCRLARMSGSGATCFALFDDDVVAQAGAVAVQAAHSDWWAVATRLRTAPPPVRETAGVAC